jgi:adenylate cyclase
MNSNTTCSLRLRLLRHGVEVFSGTTTETIEVGRRQTDEAAEPCILRSKEGYQRLVVAPIELRSFPRRLLRIDPEDADHARITNLHMQASVSLAKGSKLKTMQPMLVALPITMALPEGYELEIRFEKTDANDKTSATSTSAARVDDFSALLRTLKIPSELNGGDIENDDLTMGYSRGSATVSGAGRNVSLTQMSNVGAGFGHQQIGSVLTWLEQTVAAIQRPASSVEFFAGIAEAVTKIIDVDRAEIILWDGQQWLRDPRRSFINPDLAEGQELKNPSVSILNEARLNRTITIFPQSTSSPLRNESECSRVLHAAVACPILDLDSGGEEILGVLYADRQTGPAFIASPVMEAEQKLIAILATAIASSIGRRNREKLVTKYEQFFSAKVTEAIQQNPKLLEGEDADVTVLFCDIRRFSRETDRIGAAAAMRWVSDTLSELSEQVLRTDGVLVNYMGDELFAMWGAPEKSDDHAVRAVRTALEMMLLRSELSNRYRESLPNGLDFGIGLCTGPARVGNTGSKQKFQYGPLGRTVNLGSRIRGLTGQWSVCCLMDSTTEKSLPQEFLRRRLCNAEVFGMEGITPLYELMDASKERNRELSERYESALALFESNHEPRKAARTFGELVQDFPDDGPSVLMLVRSANELAKPTVPFTSAWKAPTK